MKGQILGFDGEHGAIRAENGERFKFSLGDWKDQRVPQPRDTVDFVAASDGQALEIYPVRGSIAAVDLHESGRAFQEKLAQAASSGVAANLVSRAQQMPTAVVALVMLLASVLLNFAKIGQGATAVTGSLISMPGELRSQGALIEASLDQVSGLLGATDRFDGLRTISSMTGLSWFLYLVPLLAIYVLYRAYADKRVRLAELALGATGILAGVYYWALREAASAAVENIPFASGAFARASFSFGMGGWLIVMASLAMLLFSLGVIRLDARSARAPAES